MLEDTTIFLIVVTILVLQRSQLTLHKRWQGKGRTMLLGTIPPQIVEKLGNAHGLAQTSTILRCLAGEQKANLTCHKGSVQASDKTEHIHA